MQVKNQDIFELLEEFCPLELAQEWDNCGLQVGNPNKPVDRILLALDIDDEVMSEVEKRRASLVVTHHPLLLKGVRQIREDVDPGRLITRIIRSGITVYAAHTNLDSANPGVNSILAEKLNLTDLQMLMPQCQKFFKLALFVPPDHVDRVRDALSKAGAGWIGNYSHCTFMVEGTGTFKPLQGANPYIGEVGALEKVEEVRLETIVPERLVKTVLEAMRTAHPYEEVAYDLYPLENRQKDIGLGRIGRLKVPLTMGDFVSMVKERLGLSAVRSGGMVDRVIHKVAVCGGSGSDLWPLALASGADVLVTGDIRYHGARDMLTAGLSFVDAGHYGTESIVLEPLAEYLRARCQEKGFEVEVLVTEVNGDPFQYR